MSINSLLQKNSSLRRLIGRLFGFKSEKKRPTKPSEPKDEDKKDKGQSENQEGHGRRGYKDLKDAETIYYPHPDLKSGDPCPDDLCDGKVYPLKNPGVYVRITANEPISTVVHLTEKFRCNLCGVIFEDIPTHLLNSEKYDESIFAHIIMHKCFYGIAYNRSAAYGPL